MSNIPIRDADQVDGLLNALGEQLVAARNQFALVVVGGAGLLALGLIDRATRDVDLVGLATHGELVSAEPLPAGLLRARDHVARDFAVPPSWLNAGPTELLRLGLPAGFLDRVHTREFGPALTVRFASRLDQIHFKLYAAVDDGGPGKHASDLQALQPTPGELLQAARWSRTHDPSPAYRESLTSALQHFGVHDPDLDV